MTETDPKTLAVYIPRTFCAAPRDPELEDDDEGFKDKVCDLIGISRDHTLASALDFLFAGAFQLKPEYEQRVNFILAVLDSFKPKNITESMMIVQMCLCHELALKMFEKSFGASFGIEIEHCANLALKLFKNYNYASEILAKIRRNGQQKMVIEHVTVENGAQAMVGQIEQGAKEG